MFNTIYRLAGVRQFRTDIADIDVEDKEMVTVRPLLLSICRADERYYTGARDAKILYERLPMALIHEAAGLVVRDPTGHFKAGDRVALIPTHAHGTDDYVSANYLSTSTFRSSTEDGFAQEIVLMEPENLVLIPEAAYSNMNGFLEVVSVAVQSVRRLQEMSVTKNAVVGIWGDGNVAYITAVTAKALLPNSKIVVFGKHEEKLGYIGFADTYLIDDIPSGFRVDQAIEAVGGRGSEMAIDQIIELIKPKGTVILSGVSENPVLLNTRSVLEKGISLVGTTRSTRQDFLDAVNLVANMDGVKERLELLVQNVKVVESIEDFSESFDADLNMTWGKTILRWNI